jgi:hypothetical protein
MAMTPDALAELAARRSELASGAVFSSGAAPTYTTISRFVPPTPDAVTEEEVTTPESVTETPTAPAVAETTTDRPPAAFVPRNDARNTIRAALATYGLESLSDYLYGVYSREEVNIDNPDAVLFAIRGQDAYKQRFAANTQRASKNLPELDPASYIALEGTYRDYMRSAGLPVGFYDQTDDFTKLIASDVSPNELASRIQSGFQAVRDADPEVLAQLRRFYPEVGGSEESLAAYFLDPQRAAPLLKRQAEAARIAARGREQAGMQLAAETAEQLVARGVTPEEAQQRFQEVGALRGLYQEMAGEEALTEQQKVGAAFGYDVEAARAIAQRKGRRIAEFAGGGGFARTTGATSGTVETGVGTAQ